MRVALGSELGCLAGNRSISGLCLASTLSLDRDRCNKTKNKISFSSALWLEHTQKGLDWWSGNTTSCVLGAPAVTLWKIFKVKDLLALISEAICLLYGFLCLYDLVFAFWPHCDTVVEFAVPKGLYNRLCGLPAPQSLFWYIFEIYFLCSIDWLA